MRDQEVESCGCVARWHL